MCIEYLEKNKTRKLCVNIWFWFEVVELITGAYCQNIKIHMNVEVARSSWFSLKLICL